MLAPKHGTMVKLAPVKHLRNLIIGALADYDNDNNELFNATKAANQADVIIKRMVKEGWLRGPAQALGSVGGKERARKLSPKRRKEIAKRAATARWGKAK